jgi:hypothetical protein
MKNMLNGQSFIVAFGLLFLPVSLSAKKPAAEHEIEVEMVKKNLADVHNHAGEKKEEQASVKDAGHDLSKINSSTEQLPVNFDAIENSIHRLQEELEDLKVHLADIKESVLAKAEDEKNMRARLKAELDRKAVVVPAQDAVTEASLAENEIDDDDDIEIDDEQEEQEQDAVEIIAKECEDI